MRHAQKGAEGMRRAFVRVALDQPLVQQPRGAQKFQYHHLARRVKVKHLWKAAGGGMGRRNGCCPLRVCAPLQVEALVRNLGLWPEHLDVAWSLFEEDRFAAI